MERSRAACPNCHAEAATLQLTKTAWVEYFACKRCGLVWNVPKGQDEPVTTVLPPRRARVERDGA